MSFFFYKKKRLNYRQEKRIGLLLLQRLPGDQESVLVSRHHQVVTASVASFPLKRTLAMRYDSSNCSDKQSLYRPIVVSCSFELQQHGTFWRSGWVDIEVRGPSEWQQSKKKNIIDDLSTKTFASVALPNIVNVTMCIKRDLNEWTAASHKWKPFTVEKRERKGRGGRWIPVKWVWPSLSSNYVVRREPHWTRDLLK